MSLGDQPQQAGAHLHSELEQAPVPQRPDATGRLKVLAIAAAAIVVVGGVALWLTRTDTPTPIAPTVTTSLAVSTTSTTVDTSVLAPICEPGAWREAPDGWYRDEPVYIDPSELRATIRDFASTLDGYETIWSNRDRNNWIQVGFVGTDVDEQQRALEAEFPDAGVVAVELDYTAGQLDTMAEALNTILPGDMAAYTTDVRAGTISVWVGKVTVQDRAVVGSFLNEYPVCAAGLIGDQIGEAGPQQPGGDGWRLLGEFERSIDSHPRIITSSEALTDLWAELRIDASMPEVEWDREIVLVFEVSGRGDTDNVCSATRFDGVVSEEGLLQGVVVNPVLLEQVSAETACPMGYSPYVYVIAIERSLLPTPPYTVRTAPSGWETTVETDLRETGSTLPPIAP